VRRRDQALPRGERCQSIPNDRANSLMEKSCWSLGYMKVNTQRCCSCRPRRMAWSVKWSWSTLLSSANPRRSRRQRGRGAQVQRGLPNWCRDWPLAVAKCGLSERPTSVPANQRPLAPAWAERGPPAVLRFGDPRTI